MVNDERMGYEASPLCFYLKSIVCSFSRKGDEGG